MSSRFLSGAGRSMAVLLVLSSIAMSCSPGTPRGQWKIATIPTDAIWDGIWFSDSLNGWISGGGPSVQGGILGRTRDGGRTWRFESGLLPGGIHVSLPHVSFSDTSRGRAVSDAYVALLSEDGGGHWRSAQTGMGSLHDAQFLDSLRGWAAGSAGIVATRDGGRTWESKVRDRSQWSYLSVNAFHFIDEQRGWLVGHSGVAMHTQDGGETWARAALPLELSERPTLWDVTFVGALDGWIVGEAGVVLRTGDGGLTWARQSSGVPVVRVIPRGEAPPVQEVIPELQSEPDRLVLSAVRFADTERGWAVGYYSDVAESVVLATRDGGGTWAVEKVVQGEQLRSLFVLDSRHAWAVGDRVRTGPQVVLRYDFGATR